MTMVDFVERFDVYVPFEPSHDGQMDLSTLAVLYPGDHRAGRRVTMTENQWSISEWAEETFGPAGSTARVAARANEEMAELLRHLTTDERHPKAAEEVADIYIVLCRVASRLGIDIQDEVDRKMAINRAREWRLDGTGHGYHR
jgi:NTP pyrophosphatase (non-canonical NTP hydrolase)